MYIYMYVFTLLLTGFISLKCSMGIPYNNIIMG